MWERAGQAKVGDAGLMAATRIRKGAYPTRRKQMCKMVRRGEAKAGRWLLGACGSRRWLTPLLRVDRSWVVWSGLV